MGRLDGRALRARWLDRLRLHDHVTGGNLRRGLQLHAWPRGQRITSVPRVTVQRLGQIGRQRVTIALESEQVRRVQHHPVAARHVRPVRAQATLGLHRSLEPALYLNRLQPRLEEASGGPFEETLKEPLNCG